MAGRILTLQRQARELGRLRTGTFNGRHPERSSTWIVTSHAEHYVHAAADTWGGTPEQWQPQGNGAQQWRVVTEQAALDAILPPGDPLSQSYEQWSKGGCQRRCDGMSEELSSQPCLCRAQWGDAFHEVAPRDVACKMTTRLNVILPDMPDIGAWRVETHSYYSANEMSAAVDVLKGAIGEAAMIPIRLRIEQRTRVAEGQTKHFPVVAVELRGATAGQVLAGAAPAIGAVGQGSRPALEASGMDFLALIRAAESRDAVLLLWQQARDAGVANGAEVELAAIKRVAVLAGPGAHLKAAAEARTSAELTARLEAAQAAGFATNLLDADDPVAQAFVQRRTDLAGADGQAAASQPAREAVDAEALWAQVVAAWPGDRTSEIEDAFAARYEGVHPGSGTPEQLRQFLADVQAGTVKPADSSMVPF